MMNNFAQSNKTGVFFVAVALTFSLINQPAKAQNIEQTPPPQPTTPAEISPERQRSYLGIGGAIGLSGNTTALSTGGFTFFSKTVFTNNLSIHSANVVFGSKVASSTTALTLDLPIRNSTSKQIIISPFVGGGIMTQSQNGLRISPHVTGGVDVPLSTKFAGTVRLNVGFPSEKKADIGILLGVGYNF